MAHGRRKGVARGCNCPTGKGMCFTSYDAAQAAVIRLKAERSYTCDACGHLHVTRYSLEEFNERVLDKSGNLGCTTGTLYDTVVSYTDEEGTDEAQADEPPAQAAGAEHRGDAGDAPRGPRAPSVQRRSSPRLAPSPAEVAALVSRRRNQGR